METFPTVCNRIKLYCKAFSALDIILMYYQGQWRNQEFFRGGGGGERSTNSVEDRGRIEQGSGGGSPLDRGSAQFANG
jgi:hypothetical protein